MESYIIELIFYTNNLRFQTTHIYLFVSLNLLYVLRKTSLFLPRTLQKTYSLRLDIIWKALGSYKESTASFITLSDNT